MKTIFILIAAIVMLVGCSDDDAQNKETHVWKEQTDAMNKARAVEGVLQDSADAEQKQIEEQAR